MFLNSPNSMVALCHLSFICEDDTSIIQFFVFPKNVIIKMENNTAKISLGAITPPYARAIKVFYPILYAIYSFNIMIFFAYA